MQSWGGLFFLAVTAQLNQLGTPDETWSIHIYTVLVACETHIRSAARFFYARLTDNIHFLL
jgi:hypothetical protein